ncbi:MAG: response regulator transcription factor [Chitinophagaceae bacterium]|nr:response regulator transcription factor [Chitinophagaceae bacterium]
MQPLSCVIIDDEPIARNILKEYIVRDDRLLLLQDYSNASDALRDLNLIKPRLLFLDIKMPKITGFEMLRSLPHHPMVIFTTAYREFAVEGFDLNAVDYLLKPFSFERFLQAVNKAYVLMSAELNPGESPASPSPDNQEDDLFVKSNGKLVRIRVSDILYVEALKEYVRIFTPGSNQVVYQTMQNLEERLPRDNFFRVHRSYIIGLRHVQSIEGNSVLINGMQLPVSRYCKEEFIKRVSKNKLL